MHFRMERIVFLNNTGNMNKLQEMVCLTQSPMNFGAKVSAGKTTEAPNPGYEKPAKIYLKTLHFLSMNLYKLQLVRNLTDVKAILIRPNSPG